MKTAPLRAVALVAAAALITLVVSPASSTSDESLQRREPAELRVATFNLLGDSHTQSGSGSGWAAVSSGWAERFGSSTTESIDIVGFQEMEDVQVAEFQRLRGGGGGCTRAPHCARRMARTASPGARVSGPS